MQGSGRRCFFIFLVSFLFVFTHSELSYSQYFYEDTASIFESQNDSIDLSSVYWDATDSAGIYFFYDVDTVTSAILTLSYDSISKSYGGVWSNEVLFLYDQDFKPSEMTDSIRIVLQDSIHKYYTPLAGVPSSGFGWRWRRWHYGEDINAHYYDTIRCAFDGVVRIAKYGWGYGNCVVVRHQNGLETLYGHNSVLKVVANQEVKAGDVLALAGCTGWCYGPHLHFEIRYLGIAIDPSTVIDFQNEKLYKDTIYLSKADFQYLANYKTGVTASSSTLKSTASGTTTTAVYYTIKSGDTLSKIAKYYGTTVTAICSLNGIKSTTLLKIGKTLRVK